jgi:hypothetical protein
MTFMEQYGAAIGAILVLLVSACGFLLARRAAGGVKAFREEHHESFLGGGKTIDHRTSKLEDTGQGV